MSSRRAFLVHVSALVGAPFAVRAQPAGRVFRIGVLLITARAHPGADRLMQPFLRGMRELGYVDGRNLIIEWREAEGRAARLSALASELVALKVDLIVAGGHEAAYAAKAATEAIPIVFVASNDPVGQGLVKSYSRPGGNVTGFTSEILGGKRLELLREVAPQISRVAVLHVSGDTTLVAALREPSARLKLQLLLHELKSEVELDNVFRTIEQERPEGMIVLGGVFAYVHRERILRFTAAQRLPAIYPLARWVEDGGLMSYALDYADNWRRTVAYVDRILKGASPADLPVQLPTKYELVLNRKAAKALGLAFPPSVLLRADRLIE